MIVMGLNLGICSEKEKDAKKAVILDYLTSHLKVKIIYFLSVFCFVLNDFLNVQWITSDDSLLIRFKVHESKRCVRQHKIEVWYSYFFSWINARSSTVFATGADINYIFNCNLCSFKVATTSICTYKIDVCRFFSSSSSLKYRLFCQRFFAVFPSVRWLFHDNLICWK